MCVLGGVSTADDADRLGCCCCADSVEKELACCDSGTGDSDAREGGGDECDGAFFSGR